MDNKNQRFIDQHKGIGGADFTPVFQSVLSNSRNERVAVWSQKPCSANKDGEPGKIFRGPFVYSVTRDARELDEVFQLRFRVYCLEKGWLDPALYPSKRERDEYDPNSLVFIAQNLLGQIVGTARLILPCGQKLPIADHFGVRIPASTGGYGEISRVICLKEARCMELAVGFFNFVYNYCEYRNITNVFAILEKPLFRLMQRAQFTIEQVGGEKFYFGGITLPVVFPITTFKSLPNFLYYFV